MRAQKGVEVYLYSFFNLETRCVGGKPSPLLLNVPERDPAPIVQAHGWAQGRSGWVRIYRRQGDSIPGPSSP
jgi:hypothetical protein